MNRNEISERLQQLRKEKGVSQQEVAKAINISDSAMSAYEMGDRIPRDEVKLALAEYFGKTVQEIFFS